MISTDLLFAVLAVPSNRTPSQLLSSADTELLNRLTSISLADYDVVFLFGRTALEKETWFYRLQAATRGAPYLQSLLEIVPGAGSANRTAGSSSSSSNAQAGAGGTQQQPQQKESGGDTSMYFRVGIEDELFDVERPVRKDSLDSKAGVKVCAYHISCITTHHRFTLFLLLSCHLVSIVLSAL